MKFRVKSLTKYGPRLGELYGIENKPDLVLETPLALLHTQAGHIPHITHEVFKLVSQTPQILQIPLVSVHQYQDAIRLYEGRVSEFVGNRDNLTCITLHDPANLTKQGHHVKGKVPVFTKHGKVLYSADMYVDMVQRFKPDMWVLLSDSDTNKSSPQKRVTKAVEHTVSFNAKCVKRIRNSESLRKTFVVAPVAGGYCKHSRRKCIQEISVNDSHVDGYLIDGLHNNGPEVEFLPFDEVKEIVDCVLEKIPSGKIRLVQGCWSPVNILRLVKSGVDMFDTSYCVILTERSAALTFSTQQGENSEYWEIILRQTSYSDDFDPIMKTCQCLTCRNYSRAYVHHLLTVQELLGPILIMVHNVYRMLMFFEKIRESIKTDTFREFEQHVTQQYRDHLNREQHSMEPDSDQLNTHKNVETHGVI
ncbi:queuine tRNA-ribosyltransferase accessory subunit 2 [Cylas formicarius]|uniref:queuine tRNA-ribosyltransferase accessory subunit 2 n=1 Tax=Cylas formicarius TaxID=197179 RepID=UPI0029587101|nr:queuine tRNA-ribosyltransferase accessory subunit 2 [Cylas formicarius]